MEKELETLKIGRILALKVIAESYLVSKGNKKVDELFPKKPITSETELAGGDILVLHHWLVEQYRQVGLDLNKIIEATGEKVEPGKLSQFELKELLLRADELMLMFSILKKYQQK